MGTWDREGERTSEVFIIEQVATEGNKTESRWESLGSSAEAEVQLFCSENVYQSESRSAPFLTSIRGKVKDWHCYRTFKTSSLFMKDSCWISADFHLPLTPGLRVHRGSACPETETGSLAWASLPELPRPRKRQQGAGTRSWQGCLRLPRNHTFPPSCGPGRGEHRRWYLQGHLCKYQG